MEPQRRDIDDLKAEYKRRRPGGHWFEPNTMRFFRSRIGQVWQVGQVWLFVSSEQNHGRGGPYPRLYTVRRMDETGDIDTVGKFQEWTRNTVCAAIKQAIAHELVKAAVLAC